MIECYRYLKFMFREIIQISVDTKIIIRQLYTKISYGDWQMVWKLQIATIYEAVNMLSYDMSPNE